MLRNRAAALVLFLSSSSLAFALGVGNIEQISALNEPFDARIEIVGASVTDFDSLAVTLARSEQFERAGVPRTAVLLKLRFDIVQGLEGGDYIKITSHEPIREPFLNFLLELNWANGKLVREYTVLLDPPLYDRHRRPAASAPRAPARPAATSEVPAEPFTAAAGGRPAMIGGYVEGGTVGPVQSGDTLWSIAAGHRPDAGVSVQQMMLALLRTNPEAFADGNINQLKRGAVLHIPDQAAIAGIGQREALEEVRRHHQLWDEYRQGAAAGTPEQPLGVETGTAAQPPSVTTAEAEGRLELVAPGGEGETAGTGEGKGAGAAGGATGDIELLREELDASGQANKETLAKLQEAEEIIALLQRQVEIKDQELAAMQARLAELGINLGDLAGAPATGEVSPEGAKAGPTETPAPVPEAEVPAQEPEVATPEVDISPGAEGGPAAEEAEPPAEQPAATAPVEPESPAAEPAAPGGAAPGIIPAYLLDIIPGGVMTLIGLAGVILLGVAGLVVKIFVGRRGVQTGAAGGEAAADATLTAVTAPPAAEEEPITETRGEPETGGPRAAARETTATAGPDSALATIEATAEELMGTPEEDPLDEVNVYLAYERFTEAEEIVKRVIGEHPKEHKYKLRLLEVYYSANDKRAYEEAARTLHAAVGDTHPLWQSAVAMWSEMSPDRRLFAAPADGAAAEAVSVAAAAKTFVDITGDSDAGTIERAVDATQIGVDAEPMEYEGLDFDLTASAQGAAESDSDLIDLTGGGEGGEAMFDLTSPGEQTDGEILDLTAVDDGGMLDLSEESDAGILDLTGGDDAPPQAPSPETADLLDVTKTGDLNLDAAADLMNVTSPGLTDLDRVLDLEGDQAGDFGDGILDITGSTQEDADALDFDISSMEVEAGVEEAIVAAEPVELVDLEDEGDALQFDVSGETPTGSETADVEVVAPTQTGDDAIEFDIEDLAAVAGEEPGVVAGDTGVDFDLGDGGLQTDVEAAEGAAQDFDLSLQGAELDNLALGDAAGASAAEKEAEIEFDLSLQDTTDMDSLVIDDTLELPEGLEEAAEGPVSTDEMSLEDLTRSMEDAMAELDLGDDSGLELTAGDAGEAHGEHIDTMVLDDRFGAPAPASEQTVVMPRDSDIEEQSDVDEADTKLNLAKAYIELGDKEGARSILDEVARDGTGEQQAEARQLLDQI